MTPLATLIAKRNFCRQISEDYALRSRRLGEQIAQIEAAARERAALREDERIVKELSGYWPVVVEEETA